MDQRLCGRASAAIQPWRRGPSPGGAGLVMPWRRAGYPVKGVSGPAATEITSFCSVVEGGWPVASFSS